MGPPQPVGGIDIETLEPPVAVDHRIKLLYYFRIADALLTQAKIYQEEKNLLELYVILVRYSSLLCETIPKHYRDCRAVKSREKEFFKKDIIDELELLKPVLHHYQQITELNWGGTMEPHSLNGTYAATYRTKQHTPRSHTPHPLVGSATGSLQKFGRHRAASLPSVQPDKQIPDRYASLSYPKEETLSRDSILGPGGGLSGRWAGTVAGIKVQYPMNVELTQSDISSCEKYRGSIPEFTLLPF